MQVFIVPIRDFETHQPLPGEKTFFRKQNKTIFYQTLLLNQARQTFVSPILLFVNKSMSNQIFSDNIVRSIDILSDLSVVSDNITSIRLDKKLYFRRNSLKCLLFKNLYCRAL